MNRREWVAARRRELKQHGYTRIGVSLRGIAATAKVGPAAFDVFCDKDGDCLINGFLVSAPYDGSLFAVTRGKSLVVAHRAMLRKLRSIIQKEIRLREKWLTACDDPSLETPPHTRKASGPLWGAINWLHD